MILYRPNIDGTIGFIEDWYQAAKVFEDGTTGLNWRLAKGRKSRNAEFCRTTYSRLWDAYVERNSDLLEILRAASRLSDTFEG